MDLITLKKKYLANTILDRLKDFTSISDIDTLHYRVEEFFKFLIISSELDKESMFIPITKEIDEIWHFFILQTKSYIEMCNFVKLGFFLHHESVPMVDYEKHVGKDTMIKEDLYILASYYQKFGPLSSNNYVYWLLPKRLIDIENWNIDKVNNLAKEVIDAHEAIEN